MATLADLVKKLTFQMQLSTGSVDSGKFTTEILGGIIMGSIMEHNPALTLATLTYAEERPVLLLAEIETCYIRAAEHGNDDPPKAPGSIPSLGAQNTPFTNWMKLAAQLMVRYNDICRRLGLNSGAQNVVVVSTSYKQSERFADLYQRVQMPGAPPATLSCEAGDDGPGSVNVLWATTQSDQFFKFLLFQSLNPGIYRPSNPNGVMRVPNISPSASLVHYSFDQNEEGIIVPNLQSGVTMYFLLVTQAQFRKFSYSNEVSMIVP